MKDSRLEFKLSEKLKQDFEAICKETETSVSSKLREMIANLVRNHKRQTGKTEKTSAN